MKKALIVRGGWDGHFPVETAEIMADALSKEGFEVEVSGTLDTFKDEGKLDGLDLIVPHWTMGDIAGDQLQPLAAAIRGGVGLAGIHGGMGDAFRQACEFQFMVGGQFVSHPGGGGMTYGVHICDTAHPVTAGVSDFEVTSEQYYMHVDPAIQVLATTNFVDFDNAIVPVTWTKHYGQGRVFYCSLGHSPDVLAMEPVLTMVTRGMAWASR